MTKLKTYIINLATSTVRKEYMEKVLRPYPFLDATFVQAVDGRKMSDEERNSSFDYARCLKMYGHHINPGEVGCVLSHRKCYDAVLANGDKYALILEDDVKVMRDLRELDLQGVERILDVTEPRVLMLSGDYWFWRKAPFVRLFSAVGAYAYIVNASAAKLILSLQKPCNVADDWTFYRRLGLRMYAVHPYMLDANVNMEMLPSDVKQDMWGIDRKRMSAYEVIVGYVTGSVKRFLKSIGHFERKIRVVGNVIVPEK